VRKNDDVAKGKDRVGYSHKATPGAARASRSLNLYGRCEHPINQGRGFTR
jgi:hypothetical protein